MADDSLLVKEGLVRLLASAGHDVVGTADDYRTVLREVRLSLPDAVVMDIRMPPTRTTEGLEAAGLLRQEMPTLGILVLSQYLDAEYAVRLLGEAPGHAGYLLKDHLATGTVLVDALERVAAGECVVDPAVVRALVDHRRPSAALSGLSPRELEVLALVAEGHTNAAIAHRLSITVRTVESHVRQIFLRLELLVESEERSDRRVLAVLAFLRATQG
ncbi:response regulator [Microbacterium sp. B2969]|uniref:Response regulator n=1 Tax=Microbacterium alkaliflavum TaxID=3248839 RepID=A0ABW7QFG8_9MICO